LIRVFPSFYHGCTYPSIWYMSHSIDTHFPLNLDGHSEAVCTSRCFYFFISNCFDWM